MLLCIETVAGINWTTLPDGLPATRYRFDGLSDVAVGSAGEVYIVERFQKRIRKIGTDGILKTILAPDARRSVSGQLVIPTKFAVDRQGNVLVSDGLSGSVRSVRLVGRFR